LPDAVRSGLPAKLPAKLPAELLSAELLHQLLLHAVLLLLAVLLLQEAGPARPAACPPLLQDDLLQHLLQPLRR
jgi:hypothetical protein